MPLLRHHQNNVGHTAQGAPLKQRLHVSILLRRVRQFLRWRPGGPDSPAWPLPLTLIDHGHSQRGGEHGNDRQHKNGYVTIPVTREPPPQRTRVARALVSTASKGSIPTTLGGKIPPVSILSRREFGLRMLRK